MQRERQLEVTRRACSDTQGCVCLGQKRFLSWEIGWRSQDVTEEEVTEHVPGTGMGYDCDLSGI